MGSREGRVEREGGTHRERETNKSGVSHGYGLVCEACLADAGETPPRAWRFHRLPHRRHEPSGSEEGWAGMSASSAGWRSLLGLPTASGVCWAPPARW